MKIVIAATPEVAIPSIELLKQQGHQIKVVTQPDSAAGRGMLLRQTPVASFYPESLKPKVELELQEILEGCELLITIGYGRILSLKTLAIPSAGGINLHFSLLPKWRGAAPVQRAIEAGDELTGVTIFQMDEGVDTGDIWQQAEYLIPNGISSAQLFDELANLGAQALAKSIDLIAEGMRPRPQEGQATFAKKISKSEAVIDWNQTAQSIDRKVRAFSLNPVARSTIRKELLKIIATEVHDVPNSNLAPGELSSTGRVGTGAGEIQLCTVVPSGKRAMNCNEWLNGFRPKPGERFE